VLPPALQLRREDAQLDEVLDGLGAESEVRRELTEFNERVRRVLYSTHGGPPVTTPQRDVEEEVRRWRARREERRARQRAQAAAARAVQSTEASARPRRRFGRPWFRRTGPRDQRHG
jgi:hypothetical protein